MFLGLVPIIQLRMPRVNKAILTSGKYCLTENPEQDFDDSGTVYSEGGYNPFLCSASFDPWYTINAQPLNHPGGAPPDLNTIRGYSNIHIGRWDVGYCISPRFQSASPLAVRVVCSYDPRPGSRPPTIGVCRQIDQVGDILGVEYEQTNGLFGSLSEAIDFPWDDYETTKITYSVKPKRILYDRTQIISPAVADYAWDRISIQVDETMSGFRANVVNPMNKAPIQWTSGQMYVTVFAQVLPPPEGTFDYSDFTSGDIPAASTFVTNGANAVAICMLQSTMEVTESD